MATLIPVALQILHATNLPQLQKLTQIAIFKTVLPSENLIWRYFGLTILQNDIFI